MKLALKLTFVIFVISCNNKPIKVTPDLIYFEAGTKGNPSDWRDTSFIVATANTALIAEARSQLQLPVKDRKMVNGEILPGNGGYNSNAAHQFKWHFKEDAWQFAELSMELCDGRAYSDVDLNIDHWIKDVKRFCPWNSYIKKEITIVK